MITIDGTIPTRTKVVRSRREVRSRFTLVTDECAEIIVTVSCPAGSPLEQRLRDFVAAAQPGSRLVVTGMVYPATDIRTGVTELKMMADDVPEVTAPMDASHPSAA